MYKKCQTLNITGIEELILSQINILNHDIGQGSYGKVYEVECHGAIYAAKEFYFRKEGMQQSIQLYMKECLRCSKLHHPNLVTLLGVYYSENAGIWKELPIIIMERMASNLTTFVRQQKNITFDIKISIISDVALALTYLHEQNPPIVHCNLSSNNVFVTTDNVAKVGDFGVPQVIKDSYENRSSPAQSGHDFMPPETLYIDSPNYKPSPNVDVFSFAGIVLHTFTQQWPIPSRANVFDPKTKKRIALSEVGRRSKYFDLMTGASAHLKPLIEKCLEEDPTMRPSMIEVHGMITGIVTMVNLPQNVYQPENEKPKIDSVSFMVYYLL